MNDRLHIAATILSNGSSDAFHALKIADKLIELEKSTRKKEQTEDCNDIQPTKETIAWHVKKGDEVLVDNEWKKVVNTDYIVIGSSWVFLYFDDSTSKKFHWKDIVTIREKYI